jgi:PAS domain S-box-containing protein
MADTRHDQAIVVSDTEGYIRHWSDGAVRLFGYAAIEAEGQTLDLIVPRELRTRHWQGFRQAMRGGESKMDGAAINLPVLCKDGTVRTFPARFVFLRDARNHPVGAVGIYCTPEGSEQPFGPILGV